MPPQMPPQQGVTPPPPPPATVMPVAEQSMSPIIMSVIAIVALALVAWAAYWYMGSGGPEVAPVPVAEEGSSVDTGSTATLPAAPAATLPTGGSTANASLDQDLGAIDSQIGAFGTDNTSVDQGLGDQSVPQATL